MDQPCSYADLRSCLRSIASVNWITLAHAPVLHWLEQLYKVRCRPDEPIPIEPLRILDVGCGYGDLLRRIERWAAARKLPVVLTGVDLNRDAIRAAREATPVAPISFLVADAFTFQPACGVDIVVSSLLTHHLQDAEIVRFLRWMEANTRVGWFINDLHRQAIPYHAFRMFSRCTRWHAFVKHDGPVSIRRSFRHHDWHAMCKAAALPTGAYTVRSYRPARLCVARSHVQPSRFPAAPSNF